MQYYNHRKYHQIQCQIPWAYVTKPTGQILNLDIYNYQINSKYIIRYYSPVFITIKPRFKKSRGLK